MGRARLIGMILALSLAGCTAPRERRIVSNPDPSGKIPAIKEAVEHNDLTVARQLVKDLDNDDPAVRFYAGQGLERLTGDSFGYEYYLDDQQRKPAIDRWKQWLAEKDKK